jgi:Acyl-CoA reductase (LuxC)
MLYDAYVPPSLAHGHGAPVFRAVERPGVRYSAARWTPESLGRVVAALGEGAAGLRAISDDDLLAAWGDTVATFLRPGSLERRALDPPLARLCSLSKEGLKAGLEALLDGYRREPAAALLHQEGTAPAAGENKGSVLAILAASLPGLAVQPLLPALLARRPMLLKSASAEPLFAPSFLAALARREPQLANAVAAATWPGGEAALEEPVLAGVGKVIAYGGQPMLDDLGRRLGETEGATGKLIAFGPKVSLGVVAAAADLRAAAEGLARDVALFDQRGCLSVVAIYTDGDPQALASRLARELAELGERWPPGPRDRFLSAAVQHLRLDAEMRGLWHSELPLREGTVIVEPKPLLRPSPGLRTVRVHPLTDLARLPEILAPWQGKLQGAALAGEAAWALEPALARLGVSRCTAPGELQMPDAAWRNGGVDLLAELS